MPSLTFPLLSMAAWIIFNITIVSAYFLQKRTGNRLAQAAVLFCFTTCCGASLLLFAGMIYSQYLYITSNAYEPDRLEFVNKELIPFLRYTGMVAGISGLLLGFVVLEVLAHWKPWNGHSQRSSAK